MDKITSTKNQQLKTSSKESETVKAILGNNKIQLLKLSHEVDIKKSVEGTRIFKVERDLGFDCLIGIVSILLTDLNKFFNVKGMSTDQVIETSYLIAEKYTHSSLEDLIYCFKKIKKGEYGELYNRLDGMIVLECLAKHEEEKAGYFEELNRESKNREKSILNIPINLVDKSLEVFKEIEKEEQKERLKQIPKL
jgi:hypothetical protein